jgi:hypothetical protein
MSNNPSDDPLWVSPFEMLLGDSETDMAMGALGSSPIQHASPISGDPATDVNFFPGQQNYQDTCAIRCQEFILERFTGMEVPEDALVQQAMDHGWYAPGDGTKLPDVGNLLELNGVAVNRYEGASIFNLANELAQGHKVIIGVDSGELWGQHPILEAIADKLGISSADHAVVVSGIDTTDPAHIQVIISDPGTGQAAASYPLEKFLDAWQDSGDYMVATQEPAPAVYNPEMANFDYALGHIDSVAGMPYEEFLNYEQQPEDLGDLLDGFAEADSDADIDTGLEPESDGYLALDDTASDWDDGIDDDPDTDTQEDWSDGHESV